MSRKLATILCLAVLIAASLAAVAQAHAPSDTGENTSIASAKVVEDPLKSWALYGEVEDGTARYFRVDMKQGERIYGQIFVPHEDGTLPGLALVGPGIQNVSVLPYFVEVPAGAGAQSFNISLGEKEYEPFTPASYYYLAQFDVPAPQDGAYYIVVFNSGSDHAHYGIAIGYKEEFTVQEWLTIPFNLYTIKMWEEESPIVFFMPMILALAVGLGGMALLWRSTFPEHPLRLLGSIAGLMLIGSGGIVLEHMAFALQGATNTGLWWVTVLFALIPLALGIIALWLSTGSEMTVKKRIGLIAVGALAIAFWGGYIVAPIIAMIAGALPKKIALKPLRGQKKKEE